MMSRSPADGERATVRALVFSHLAGIVLAPVVKALWDRKVFDLLNGPSQWTGLDEIVEHTHGNRGYLRVALRLLTSFGWLEEHVSDGGTHRSYALTRAGVLGSSVAPPLYEEVVEFVPKAIFLEDFLFGTSDEIVLPSLQELVARAKSGWGLASDHGPESAKVHDQIQERASDPPVRSGRAT